MFLGFSDLHSSQVPLVLNVQTGKISPQYHVIFDNKFETVNSLSTTESLEKQWMQIFCLNRECFLDVDYDDDGNAILPLLSELIKNFSKAKTKPQEFQPLPRFEPTSKPATNEKPMNQLVNPPLPTYRIPNHENGFQEIATPGGATEDYAPETDPVTPAAAAAKPYANEPINPAAAAATNPSNSGRPRRNVGTYKDGPATIRKFPIEGESYDFAFNIISNWEHPVPVEAN